MPVAEPALATAGGAAEEPPAPAAVAAVTSPSAFIADLAARGDIPGFLNELEASLKRGTFVQARQELADAAASSAVAAAGSASLALASLRSLVELSARAGRPRELLALLAEFGPGPGGGRGEEALEAGRVLAQAAARDLAAPAAGPRELRAAVKVLQAWGLDQDTSNLGESTCDILGNAMLCEARAGATTTAAAALTALPCALDAAGQRELVLAVDIDGHEDIADKLAHRLGRDIQFELLDRRRSDGRLKAVMRGVKALGLEAEFPDADFEWRSHALASAQRTGRREAVIGLGFGDVRLHAPCVAGLLDMGEAEIAAELAGSWGVALTPEALTAATEERAMRDLTHLRLPESVKVTFVDTEVALPTMCDVLLAAPVVGFDAEWAPIEQSSPCIMQLATSQEAFLLDLLALGCSDAMGNALRSVLSAPAVTKVGFEGAKDLGKVAAAFSGALAGCGHAAPLIDLRVVEAERRARDTGLSKKRAREGISLSSVAEQHLGLPLDKTLQMSDWARRPLSSPQRHYAAMDAWVAAEVYMRLTAAAPVPD